MNTIIECKNLSKHFGSLEAVRNLSMEIQTGSVFGLLGPNGSGKTTTIRLMLGLLEPTAGSVRVFNLDPIQQGNQVRAMCGALLEHTGLYERLSAEDNLVFYGNIWHMEKRDIQVRMEELLKKVDLWERRKEIVSNWSRGMKQKLAVARVMLHQPRLVFLDEPTAGLDPVAAAALNNDMMHLVKDEHTTIFLTTHNLSEAEKLCTQVGVLRQGKLVAFGNPHKLTQSRQQIIEIYGVELDKPTLLEELRAMRQTSQVEVINQHLEITLAEGSEPSEIVKALVMKGATIDEVHRQHSGLEQTFLTLMEEEND